MKFYLGCCVLMTGLLVQTTAGFAQTKCKITYGSEVLTGKACTAKIQKHCKSRGVTIKGQIVRGKECIKYYDGYMAAEDGCNALKKGVLAKIGSSSLPDHQRQRASWLKTASIYGEHATDENIKKLKVCEDYGHIPSSTIYWIKKKRQTLKSTWADVVQSTSKDSTSFQTLLKAAKRRNDPVFLLSVVQSELDTIETIQKNNALPFFKVEAKGLDARHASLSTMKAKTLKDIEKSLKKTKCPRNKNKKMSKRLTKLVKTHFDSGTHPKDVRRFVVTGKASKKRIAYKRITHEDLPGYACYRIKYGSKKGYDKCGMFSISIRRTKIDGQKWSKYQNVMVGSNKYMSCKNLK